MRTLIILFILLHGVTKIYGQSGELFENKAIKFSIQDETNTIEFIIIDTLLTKKKPIFLWCQGSLPIPLFGEIENYGVYFFGGGVSNFDYEEIAKKYHLVIISMPQTPLLARKENLNSSFHYIPSPDEQKKFSIDFLEADYLDNYVDRALKVLDFLSVQNWVDTEKLIISGHSQGAKIATKIAIKNSFVTHLGLFSVNPFGRVDQFIRETRLNAQFGRISWEKADSMMNEYYQFYKEANNRDSVSIKPNLKAWSSFSETFFDDWLTLDIPIYMAYGTEDRAADLCDIIPLFFIEKEKDNLTLKRYLGLEHNFFELKENGRVNHEKGYWKEVMQEFTIWID